MKKILLSVLVVALSLAIIIMWVLLAWTMCVFLSVYVYKPYALYWFILSFISIYYLFKLLTGINIFKGLIILWDNIGKYLDIN